MSGYNTRPKNGAYYTTASDRQKRADERQKQYEQDIIAAQSVQAIQPVLPAQPAQPVLPAQPAQPVQPVQVTVDIYKGDVAEDPADYKGWAVDN